MIDETVKETAPSAALPSGGTFRKREIDAIVNNETIVRRPR